jgi:hypothetical protein
MEGRGSRNLHITGRATWRAGRGIRSHEWRSLDLLPVLLGEDRGEEYRWRLVDAWHKYLDRSWRRDNIPDFQAFAVAQVVASADQISVQDDRRRRASQPPPEAGANAPEYCYSTPWVSRSVHLPPFPRTISERRLTCWLLQPRFETPLAGPSGPKYN